MASIVLVSLLGWTSDSIRRALLLNPSRVGRGEIYRLLTAAWVHGDASHLIFNLLALHLFADQVVSVLGAPRFLLIYFTAAVVAFIPTTVRYLRAPEYNSLGASGAVAAVMLSAILLHPKMQLRLLVFPVPVPGIVFALLYLAYSAWSASGERDGINHDAHFSGAIYGALLTYVLAPNLVEQSLRAALRLVGV